MKAEPTANGIIFCIAAPSGNLCRKQENVLFDCLVDAFKCQPKVFLSLRCPIKKNSPPQKNLLDPPSKSLSVGDMCLMHAFYLLGSIFKKSPFQRK